MSHKLPRGDLIEVHGWVMLNKLDSGFRYRVKDVGTVNGIPTYSFTRPMGTKVLVVHYAANVDVWLRPEGDPDKNKIYCISTPVKEVVKPETKPRKQLPMLKAGDACPIEGCGLPLIVASISGSYLECDRGHVHQTRGRCQVKGCRKLATSFTYHKGKGHNMTCADHDSWPFPP